MKTISFADDAWKQELTQAYTFRFTQTPDFTREGDHIATAVNPAHPEGFDNISLLTPKTFGPGVKARLCCAFEGLGCPEVILVEKPESCDDGAVRYGACFEIVLWKNGINVWRHYMDENHRCSWHQRLGMTIPVAEGERHWLEVEIEENYILCGVDGVSLRLHTPDLFEKFHLGVTGCEGIVRLYDLQIDCP